MAQDKSYTNFFVCIACQAAHLLTNRHHLSLHVDRNYDMNARKYVKTDTDSQFINTIIHWLYHFTNDIETEAQMKDSYGKLEEFVQQAEADPNLTQALVAYTAQFLRESFHPLLRLLCQCYYQDIFCGDVNANCFVESPKR